MVTAFIRILNMGLTASYCIVAVILLRLLLKKQPKIFSYILWSIVLFRLLCPFSLSSSFSLVRMDTDMVSQDKLTGLQGNGYMLGHGNLYDDMEQENGDTAQITLAPSLTAAEEERAGRVRTFLGIGSRIWFTGMILMIGYGLWTAYRFRRFLQGAVQVEERLYEVEGIPTPFVFGIARPGIYLPAGIAEEERRYVLEHERVHIARKDYLVKLLAWGARCIHWFNPLVWLSFVLMERDMEMACDEAVLRKTGMETKQDYSRALLSLSCEKAEIGRSPIAFGEGEVKNRVRNILSYRKKTFAACLLIAALLLAVVLGLSLNPARREEEVTGEQLKFVTDYGNAFCERNGKALVAFYIDEETAFEQIDTLEKGDGEYTFGFSSPWPNEFRTVVTAPKGAEDGQAEIWYYAWTSDPHVAVWKEEIAFVKTTDGYRVTDSSLRYLDSIATWEEYEDAYWIAGEYQFTDYVGRGFVESINYQAEYDREEGAETDRNAMYRNPVAAAEWILNLSGGEGTAALRSDGTADVEYTFADGSTITVPMYDANFDGRTENTAAMAEDSDGQNPAGDVNREVWILDRGKWNADNP